MAVSDVLLQTIEDLKESKKYQEALDYTNELMTKDPTDERLLLQIADIQYRSGAMEKATKAIDFLNHTTDNNDPM